MNKNITIIQKDTFDLSLDIRDFLCQDVAVQKVIFVCKSLGIRKEFVEVDSEDCEHSYGLLSLSSEETATLRVGNFTFDITALLEDGDEISTLYHNSSLEVKFKANKG